MQKIVPQAKNVDKLGARGARKEKKRKKREKRRKREKKRGEGKKGENFSKKLRDGSGGDTAARRKNLSM